MGQNNLCYNRLTLHEKKWKCFISMSVLKSIVVELNVYKYLKNGYLKINRDIATGKGTLGISLTIHNPKRKYKIKISASFFEHYC